MSDAFTSRLPLFDAAPQRPSRRRRPVALDATTILGAAAVLLAGAVGYLLVEAALPTQAEQEACDRVAETLLTSRDQVEITRAAALVSALGCDVARRIPAPG